MTESGTENAAAPEPEAGEDHSIAVHVFGRTDVGLIREHNEDNFLIADLAGANRSIKPEVRNHIVGSKGSLFAVCDGMGGAAAGEVASRIAVDTVYEMMQSGSIPDTDEELARRLDTAIKEAGTRIYTAARLNRGQRGMGTTVTAAVLTGPRLVLGQVGDSRAHIVRAGELVQVTKDQSLVQQLIDAKQLTEEEAKSFDKSNIILQALGTTEEVHVDMTSVELCRGDILVMCSDGLSGLVEPEGIRDLLIEVDDPMEACRKLTDKACDMGGDDNITVIVARFEGGALGEPTKDSQLAYEQFEYPKAGEVTVRSAYPKDPNAPAEDVTEKVVEQGEHAAATEQPAEQPTEPAAEAGQPDEAAAGEGESEAAQPAAEADQTAAEEPEADEAEDEDDVIIDVPGGAGRKGPLIAVLAVVLVGAVIAAYFTMRGGSDPGANEASDVALPGAPGTAADPAAPTAGASVPADLAAPPLAPIDERDILGKAKKAAKAKAELTDTASGTTAEEPDPEPEIEEEPHLSPKVDQPIDGEPLEADPWSPSKKKHSGKKKSGKKKKKKKQVIEDNPYD